MAPNGDHFLMTTSAEEQNHSASRPAARPLGAIILAAGKGTRMESDLPKVAHPVADRAMVAWVVDACRAAGATRIIVVVGHRADIVRGIFPTDHDIEFVTQDEQLGTGHATLVCEPALADFDGDVLVLAGDGPLIRARTLRTMLDRHRNENASATLATSVIDDPTGYGRIVRGPDHRFERIVEQKNASDEERAIREVYPSYACFDCKELFEMLHATERDPISGEYYLTVVPEMLRTRGRTVEIVDAVPPEDVLSINTLVQLAEVDAILRDRVGANA